MVNERIVICGAGVIGAAVAYELTRRGRHPTLLDRSGPAAAASGRAGGFLALDWNDGTPVGPLARRSFALHEELARTLPDAGYRRMETLQVVAAEDGDLRALARMASPGWLDGNVAVCGVIGTPQTTAQVDPHRFTRALVDAAVAAGAAMRVAAVTGLDLSGPDGRVRGVHTEDGHLPADIVVLALGPWTSRAAAWVSLPRVHALKGASVTLAADVPAQAVFSDFLAADGRRSPEIYPRAGGVVYVNGYPEHEPLPDDPDDVHPSEVACATLHRMAGAHSSVLADARVLTRRACYRPVTDDGVPIIGPVPGAPGVYVATGHGPWGILNAPATGEMVAEMIVDGRGRTVATAPFAPRRLGGSAAPRLTRR